MVVTFSLKVTATDVATVQVAGVLVVEEDLVLVVDVLAGVEEPDPDSESSCQSRSKIEARTS